MPRSTALKAGESGFVVVNQTPFYGESGGQIGDAGTIKARARWPRSPMSRRSSATLRACVTVKQGELKAACRRARGRSCPPLAIRANHSATHLLHEALRLVLGDHVAQKGSLVSPDRLRFDILASQADFDEELAKVEDIANAIVLRNEPVTTRLMSVDDAIAEGARALFGEKYGDEVRVVSMGTTDAGKPFSIELCGGTHATRTGDIGVVSVVGESAVAAGVRGSRQRPARRRGASSISIRAACRSSQR
jgi:alanyl-tRNA synthetase